MTDMTPRPAIDAMCEYARDVAALAAATSLKATAAQQFEREARERLYQRIDNASMVQGHKLAEWERAKRLEAQLDELTAVLDEVRSVGVEPVVMLRELVRVYRGGHANLKKAAVDLVNYAKPVPPYDGTGRAFLGPDVNGILYLIDKLGAALK